MQNLIADTQMRGSISGAAKPENPGPGSNTPKK
jgi:hypothetical protein